MKRLIISCAVIVVLLANACFAESKPVNKKTTRAKEKQKIEQTTATKQAPKKILMKFTMGMVEGNRIDPNYAGPSIESVIESVEKTTNLTKGEFESTAAFNARKETAISAKFLNGFTIDDTFAFVVPVSKGGRYLSGIAYEFDADTSEVRFFALAKNSSLNGIGDQNFKPSYSFNSPLMDQFSVYRRIDRRNSYEASNAYGAKITVNETVSSDFGIAAPTIPFLTYKRSYLYSNPTPASQIKMESSKAQKELPALKAIIIMKLAAPYMTYHFVHIKPTRDSPSEITSKQKFLTGEVLGIIFYSGLTGEIFARIPEDFGKAMARPEAQPQEKASEGI